MHADPASQRSVELILPAHNEERSIPLTVREFLQANASAPFRLRVLVAEDGSSDDTRGVVERLGREYEGQVAITPPSERKGYSKAVLDAARSAGAEIVAFCDGDGQFDPQDLAKLVAELTPGCAISGRRSPRLDSRFRILASRSFGLVYRLLIGLRMGDPSSPFVVVHRPDLSRFLPTETHLSQGFWWEFFARARAAGLEIREIPVTHRPRHDGKTQVYRLRRIPNIAATHLRGLYRLRKELRNGARDAALAAASPGVDPAA